jgi:hypothetical protein
MEVGSSQMKRAPPESGRQVTRLAKIVAILLGHELGSRGPSENEIRYQET